MPMLTWRYYAAALVTVFALFFYFRTTFTETFDLPSAMGETLASKNQAYWK